MPTGFPPSAPPAAATLSAAQLRALPKAEVHVHLEGTFELADLLLLAKKHHIDLPGPAATLFDVGTHGPVTIGGTHASGLSGFLRFLDWECGLVQTSEELARIAYRFSARQASSGVRYTDVIVNPTHWHRWLDRLPELFAALAAGFTEAEQDGLGAVGVCVSLLRQQSASSAAELVDWLVRARPDKVIALSVDGDERAAGRTSGRFAACFETARRAGLRRTVHAGESSGPEGVWDAIELLGAERIDHGVRAVDDPALLSALADRNIPLGVCPTSNLTLGLYENLAAHPLERLRAAGVTITVNTDDPAPLGIRLEQEWALCAAAFDWTPAEVVELARSSVRASFADADRQAALLRDIDDYAVCQAG